MKRKFCLSVALAVAMMSTGALAKAPTKVVAHLKDAAGKDVGDVIIRQHQQGVRLYLGVKSLPPGDHAMHFHEKPSCEPPDFKSAGGHFNPTGAHHGLKNPEGPHAGDMQNIHVAANGTSGDVVHDERVTLQQDKPNSLFANGGTALVIHAKADDMVSDPAGNAGDRIACGVITK